MSDAEYQDGGECPKCHKGGQMSAEYNATKARELRAFAKEYEHYASKMPSDPYAHRWITIAEALRYQADELGRPAEQ